MRLLTVALVLLLLGGCHRWGAPRSTQPFGEHVGNEGPFNQVANLFVEDLRAGRYKEAYARTSADYQKATSEDQFTQLMKDHPFPSGGGSASYTGGEGQANSRTYRLEEKLSGGRLELQMEVVKAANDYQVHKISVAK